MIFFLHRNDHLRLNPDNLNCAIAVETLNEQEHDVESINIALLNFGTESRYLIYKNRTGPRTPAQIYFGPKALSQIFEGNSQKFDIKV